ncbi:SDR family NAD(P)-dependent oxidoreductase [Umezawaea sp. NPDC059074]|uniref:SDR family NAD(P)-dependent oxidoreductase n=1 Tax=Umezawaea sp. NPDC059074 TaxID=3346716 RepID=UPI00368D7B09
MNIAVVTGASSGIGRSAAIQLAKRGIGVVATYNSNRKGVEETVSEVHGVGGTAVALRLSLSGTADFSGFRAELEEALATTWHRDSFDHLVNNAGVGIVTPLGQTTEKVFDSLTEDLFKGPFFLTQELLPVLADGGTIVNVTSNATRGHVTGPGWSVYASLKGAMSVLTRYLAKELSPRGIRVNAVAPGATHTRFADNVVERHPEIVPELAKAFALGRIGEPDDIGMVIATLVSEEGRWITGQDIEVSGGQNL